MVSRTPPITCEIEKCTFKHQTSGTFDKLFAVMAAITMIDLWGLGQYITIASPIALMMRPRLSYQGFPLVLDTVIVVVAVEAFSLINDSKSRRLPYNCSSLAQLLMGN